MQRWEYLTIGVWDEKWSDNLGRSGVLPRREAPLYWNDPAGLLNEVGEQGWELTGVAGSEGTNGYWLFLKRSRE
jgi:hypothetical protein